MIDFLFITPNESSSWTLFQTKTPFCLNSPKMGKLGRNGKKFANLSLLCLISWKLTGKFSFNHTKWIVILTSFSSQNAILIELPELRQIWQKWAKIHQFYKLWLISRIFCDKVSSNHSKWRLIWTLSPAKTSYWLNHPKVGKLGQNGRKFANFTNFA